MAASLIEKHLRAIELRKQGWSYSQIKKELQVSKSSLSLWLRQYPLTKDQLHKLVNGSARELRVERYRLTRQASREKRLREIYNHERARMVPLSKRELWVAGLFLYWGEGGKTADGTVVLSNTNPKVVKFFLYWLTKVCFIKKPQIRIRLHLYKDMIVSEEIEYWSRELGLHPDQFQRPYVKATTLRGLTYKTFGHGTCNLIVHGQKLRHQILMGIEAIADYYGGRI